MMGMFPGINVVHAQDSLNIVSGKRELTLPHRIQTDSLPLFTVDSVFNSLLDEALKIQYAVDSMDEEAFQYRQAILYIADTYNNKIKILDLKSKRISTLIGTGRPGNNDGIKTKARLNEPDDIKFFAGYSGWAPNQLQRELKENSWVVTESTVANIMDADPENLWKDIMQKTSKENAVWANYPVNPSLN